MENQYELMGLSPPADSSPRTNWEDIHSKRLVDSASRHVTEGRFEQARLQLEAAQRLCAGTKGLPELLAIAEVCLAAAGRSCPCKSRWHNFQDWYHILQIDEKADINLIKKRYRQLALLLHPDKNTHVKAAGAFKYISQAYDCLSDKNKRTTFNLSRAKLFCRRCSVASDSPGSIPIVADLISTRYSEDQEAFSCRRGYFSSVCRPSDVVWNLARREAFRKKARARADAAGLELGSRVWRWNREFEKLNIRRDDDGDYDRSDILSTARRYMSDAPVLWRSRTAREAPCTYSSMLDFNGYVTPQVDISIMSMNRGIKDLENSVLQEQDDNSWKSVKSDVGETRIINRSTRELAYPSYGTVCYDYRKKLPTTSEIINFFRNLPSTPETVHTEIPKETNKTSLKEVYFPSKKATNCTTIQQVQEESMSLSQSIVPPARPVNNGLPEKDLARLDSNSLLKNLDAALADITRTAGKSDYSTSVMQENNRTSSKVGVFSSRFMNLENPSRKPVSEGKTEAVEMRKDCSPNKGNSRQLLSSTTCACQPFSTDKSMNEIEENPSLFIKPLLKTQGEGNKVTDSGSGLLQPQMKQASKSLTEKRNEFDSLNQSCLQPGGIRKSEGGVAELSYRNLLLKLGSSKETTDFTSSPQVRTTISGGNPLLSPEKLGNWMDRIAGSSDIIYRRSDEAQKSRDYEAASCEREGNLAARTTGEAWWGNKAEIPSYLSSKTTETLVPDYRRIWKQADTYSDHTKLATTANTSEPPRNVTSTMSSVIKSDFSCSPVIPLGSSTRASKSDFSCSPEISLASSNRVTSAKYSYSPLVYCSSAMRTPSTDHICSSAVSQPSSSVTRLSGSEDPPQLSVLRYLQTGRIERTGSTGPGTAFSPCSNPVPVALSSSSLGDSKDSGMLSNRYHSLWPETGRKSQTGIESLTSRVDQHLERITDGHQRNRTDPSSDTNRQMPKELVVNLERLREEAKSIAATLQNFNDSSRIRKAITSPGVCNNNMNRIIPPGQVPASGLTI
ncbi:hypothetical protein R1sor_013631 [Riccia sorocarpa]|uniref:J domain-containing protein n=1 Tax=Riccia sorocarpa TaxID=122646 RepID=A0ABD3H9S2_9MARC